MMEAAHTELHEAFLTEPQRRYALARLLGRPASQAATAGSEPAPSLNATIAHRMRWEPSLDADLHVWYKRMEQPAGQGRLSFGGQMSTISDEAVPAGDESTADLRTDVAGILSTPWADLFSRQESAAVRLREGLASESSKFTVAVNQLLRECTSPRLPVQRSLEIYAEYVRTMAKSLEDSLTGFQDVVRANQGSILSVTRALLGLSMLPLVPTGLRSVTPADQRAEPVTGQRRIEELYALREPTRVREFLEAHSDLMGLLIEAHAALAYHFGAGTELAVQVVADPEAEDTDGAEELFVYVRTALDSSAAMAALDRFDDEWFLGQLDRADGRLNFNLEFI